MLQTAKLDLAFLAMICNGNDYIPALPPSIPRVWPKYMALRSQRQWAQR